MALLDDFNRSNTGPPLGGNWSVLYGATDGLKIVSNHAEPGGSNGLYGEYWNAATYGPDCDVEITVLTVDHSSDWAGIVLMLGLTNPGSATISGYEVDFYLRENGSTVDSVHVYRLDNGSTTELGTADTGFSWSNGVSFKFERIGSTLKAYYRPSGGSWTLAATRTDSTYSSAGYIGVGWWYNNPDLTDLDDFGGSTISSGAYEINKSESITVADTPTMSLPNALAVSPSESITVGESKTVSIEGGEPPGETLGIAITPDNVFAVGVRIVG